MKMKERASSIYEELRLIAKWIELGERVELSDFSSLKQVQLVETIANAPERTMTLTPLSAQMGTTRQNIRKMADSLAKKGYLTLARDETDGRSLRLRLTADGYAALKRVQRAAQIDLEPLLEDFDEKTLKTVTKSLGKIRKRLQRLIECPDGPRKD